MDIDEIELIRELCKSIIACAVEDIKRKTESKSEIVRATIERNRKDAEEFLRTRWADDIIEAAGYQITGRDLLLAAKQSNIAVTE